MTNETAKKALAKDEITVVAEELQDEQVNVSDCMSTAGSASTAGSCWGSISSMGSVISCGEQQLK